MEHTVFNFIRLHRISPGSMSCWTAVDEAALVGPSRFL